MLCSAWFKGTVQGEIAIARDLVLNFCDPLSKSYDFLEGFSAIIILRGGDLAIIILPGGDLAIIILPGGDLAIIILRGGSSVLSI